MKKLIWLMAILIGFISQIAMPIYASETKYAGKLNDLGLFQGTDKGYELERQPTRLEGLVIMLRLLGEEKNIQQYQIKNEKFDDLPDWGKKYVYYAYEKGITKGVSDNLFAPNVSLQSYAFLTYTLRALGYQDGVDENADYIWNQPELFAMSKGIVNESQLSAWATRDFVRGDAVKIAYEALKVETNSGDSLAKKLVEKGVFSKDKAVSAGVASAETFKSKEEEASKSDQDEETEENDFKINQSPIISKETITSGVEIMKDPSHFSEVPEAVKPEFPNEKPYPLLAEPTATREQVKKWAKNRGMSQEGIDLVDIYFDLCQKKGLNPVIQYAQMCHETGFLYQINSIAGLDASYHNPCGLKVTEGGDGRLAGSHKRFNTWYEGIDAHTDHSALYAGAEGYPKFQTFDPRHFPFLKGTAPMLSDLSGKWAPSWYYHRKIYIMLQEIEETKI